MPAAAADRRSEQTYGISTKLLTWQFGNPISYQSIQAEHSPFACIALLTNFPPDRNHRHAAPCGFGHSHLRKECVMSVGTVKWYNSVKGYGFIQRDDGGPDVFVHVSAVERAGLYGLNEGQKVRFEITVDRRTGKAAADQLQAA
jgi:cold shock protein